MKFKNYLTEAQDKDIQKLIKELNQAIDAAIERKDKKALDQLSKDLGKILKTVPMKESEDSKMQVWKAIDDMLTYGRRKHKNIFSYDGYTTIDGKKRIFNFKIDKQALKIEY